MKLENIPRKGLWALDLSDFCPNSSIEISTSHWMLMDPLFHGKLMDQIRLHAESIKCGIFIIQEPGVSVSKADTLKIIFKFVQTNKPTNCNEKTPDTATAAN